MELKRLEFNESSSLSVKFLGFIFSAALLGMLRVVDILLELPLQTDLA